MSANRLGTVAFSAMGILFVATALEQLVAWITMVLADWGTELVPPFAVGLLVLVTMVVGLFLLIKGRRLSLFLFGDDDSPDDAPSLPALQSIAFSVVGLWLVTESLWSLAWEGLPMIQGGVATPSSNFVTCGLSAIFGAVLFQMSGSLSRFWARRNTAGEDVAP